MQDVSQISIRMSRFIIKIKNASEIFQNEEKEEFVNRYTTEYYIYPILSNLTYNNKFVLG